jgi:hypothetical protein
MGAGASAALPDVIDSETGKRLCGDEWDHATFEAMASEGKVTKEQFEDEVKRRNAAANPANTNEIAPSDDPSIAADETKAQSDPADAEATQQGDSISKAIKKGDFIYYKGAQYEVKYANGKGQLDIKRIPRISPDVESSQYPAFLRDYTKTFLQDHGEMLFGIFPDALDAGPPGKMEPVVYLTVEEARALQNEQRRRIQEGAAIKIDDIEHPWNPPASGSYGVFALHRDDAERKGQHGMKWESLISPKSLGYFVKKEHAALAYDKDARAFADIIQKPTNFDTIEGAELAVKRADAQPPTWILDRGRPVRPPSMYHGVSASGIKWKAEIIYGGQRHHIGVYDRKEQAARAYDKRATKDAADRPLNYRGMFEPVPAAEIIQRLWEALLGEATRKKRTLETEKIKTNVRNTFHRKDVALSRKDIGVKFLTRRAFCGVCRDLKLELGTVELRSLLEEYDPDNIEKVLYRKFLTALLEPPAPEEEQEDASDSPGADKQTRVVSPTASTR